MTSLTQVESQTRQLILPVYKASTTVLQGYANTQVTPAIWLEILRILFGFVKEAAYKNAELSRSFFDYELQRQVPGASDIPIHLAHTDWKSFVVDMEEARKILATKNNSTVEIHKAALRTARTVENAGRRTIQEAVNDRVQETNGVVTSLVKGWARVPTGRETCGFCWMLASRGPVYSARGSGLNVSHREALNLYQENKLTNDHMNAWHTGCDCKVVPVFRLDNWSGRDRYLAAERLWIESTKGFYGRDAMNAFRRAVEDGGIQEKLKLAA